jgi:hypothetical protein
MSDLISIGVAVVLALLTVGLLRLLVQLDRPAA